MMKKITLLLAFLTMSFGFSQDPATGPSDPLARNASDVVSFYGGAENSYTDTAGVTFDSFNGTTIVGDVTLGDSKTVVKYTSHLFSGIGGGSYDVSAMTMLHIDVYSPDFTNFRIKLEANNGTNVELDVPVGAPTQGVWNSYDIDLSAYSAVDLVNLKWIVPVTAGGITLYLDNVYFWRPAVDPATDATLSDLQVDGSTIAGFASGITEYDIVLPKGTTGLPIITSVAKSNSLATATINQVTSLPGDATVEVISEDTNTTIIYTVSFSVDTSTSCQGSSTEASEGSYSLGYNYSFTTTGTDVNVTFELLDTDKTGFVPQIFIAPSTFINMNGDAAPVYTGIISGFAIGDVPGFTIRGAYAGGLVTSKIFDYMVGDDCISTPPEEDVTLSDLKIDGTTIAGFSPSTTTYNIKLPDASSTPQVTLVTTTNANATVGTITQASGVPGSATFDVTSEDATVSETYTINFSIQVPLTELIGNGGFEDGDFTDWDLVPVSSGQTIITTNPSSGSYAVNINNTVPTTSVGIKSSNRGIGIVKPGDEVTVKFDARGSFDTGGLLNAELFSEISGGGATNQILSPIDLDADPDTWKSFEFTVNLGADVGGGISLLFSAVTGGGNSANIFIDNVSVVNNDQVLSTKVFEIAGLTAYPNPTQDTWTVKTQNIKMASIEVFDILGKSVLSLKPEATEATINASQLKSGLYFAKISTVNGSSSLKLVKQ